MRRPTSKDIALLLRTHCLSETAWRLKRQAETPACQRLPGGSGKRLSRDSQETPACLLSRRLLPVRCTGLLPDGCRRRDRPAAGPAAGGRAGEASCEDTCPSAQGFHCLSTLSLPFHAFHASSCVLPLPFTSKPQCLLPPSSRPQSRLAVDFQGRFNSSVWYPLLEGLGLGARSAAFAAAARLCRCSRNQAARAYSCMRRVLTAACKCRQLPACYSSACSRLTTAPSCCRERLSTTCSCLCGGRRVAHSCVAGWL